LGTVGLSRGITGDLSTTAKLTITLLMYIGRCGVVALGLAALASPVDDEDALELEDIVV
jgi:trk system potassium uptake protein TrkH